VPEWLRGNTSKTVSVLIADDSVFMRHMLRRALGRHPRIQVVAEARDGLEAVEKNRQVMPDVVVLDVEMPRVDGLSALRVMMAQRPVPVVMFSSLTHKGAQVTLEALSLGAVDFLPKPTSGFELDKAAEELCRKVLAAASAKPRVREEPVAAHAKAAERTSRQAVSTDPKASRDAGSLVVIGASAGGPQALEELVPGLPGDLGSGVIVCQHMPAGFTASMARRLDTVSALPVREASDGDLIRAGEILVAPGGHHLRVFQDDNGRSPRVSRDNGPPVHGVRPAVDVTLADVAYIYGNRLMVVILSGMGSDGAQGARKAKDRGAKVVVQDESTSVVWGMPRACYELGIADKMLPIGQIAGEIAGFSHSF
jgi:two-component system chemotaxis response regulator CheB